ncbi:MAG: ParB/RepB/Spo0J family partition protein [Candidatus Dormibacterales bacterium]
MSDQTLPAGLAMVPVENIHASSLQPRRTVSLDLVAKLAQSMRAGRHDPVLEVEPSATQPGHFEIVCGEQRWRAAKEAGLDRVLVRIHERLGSLQRLQKQYEENRLRADLTPYEDAQLVLLAKTLRDIEVAESRLNDARVPFNRLEDTRVTELAQIHQHLDGLKALLIANHVNVVKGANGPAVGALSKWHEIERTLGISEAARKAKLAILRLEPEVLNDVNALPAQHAPLIARVEGRDRRAELAQRAPHLTHRQLQAAVSRLRRDSDLSVAEAVAGGTASAPEDPLAFDTQLVRLADLCRQIARLLGILRARATDDERSQVVDLLAGLMRVAHDFQEAS